MESSQLPMVTIHPISETIPPEPIVFQLKVDLDPIIILPEHLDPEVEQPEVVRVSVAPYHAVNHLKYTSGLMAKSFHLF